MSNTLRIGVFLFALSQALIPSGIALARGSCSEAVESRENTDELVSYLQVLFERGVLGDVELHKMMNDLESGRFENPISASDAQASHEALIQRTGIESYLREGALDYPLVLDFLRNVQKERTRVETSRERTSVDTRPPFQEIAFRKVPGGKFYFGRGYQVSKIHLTQTIEVASTPITQYQWVSIMGENPSSFAKRGSESTTLEFDGKQIRLQIDHPIESVTWWSVLVYANRLSERRGLRPVYDFSEITFDPSSRAENGTLRTLGPGRLKINSPDGDYYRAEGYRLPTSAEQDLMLKLASNGDWDAYFDANSESIQKRVWSASNSRSETHAVGSVLSHKINGSDFYDLVGNVSEWGWDLHSDPRVAIPDGTNVVRGIETIRFETDRDLFVVSLGGSYAHSLVRRSGSWFKGYRTWKMGDRLFYRPSDRNSIVGFRLVRTSNEALPEVDLVSQEGSPQRSGFKFIGFLERLKWSVTGWIADKIGRRP